MKNDGDKKGELTKVSEELPILSKVQFSDESFDTPIYNIWSFAKKTNLAKSQRNRTHRKTNNLRCLTVHTA
jgi:hypothetical protein